MLCANYVSILHASGISHGVSVFYSNCMSLVWGCCTVNSLHMANNTCSLGALLTSACFRKAGMIAGYVCCSYYHVVGHCCICDTALLSAMPLVHIQPCLWFTGSNMVHRIAKHYCTGSEAFLLQVQNSVGQLHSSGVVVCWSGSCSRSVWVWLSHRLLPGM